MLRRLSSNTGAKLESSDWASGAIAILATAGDGTSRIVIVVDVISLLARVGRIICPDNL